MMTHWAQVDGVFAGQKGNPYLFGAMPPFHRYYTRISEMATKFDSPKIKRVAMEPMIAERVGMKEPVAA